MMKTIPLTQGKSAIVDEDVFDAIGKYKWCAAKQTCGIFYAVRGFMGPDGNQLMMRMHHCVVGQPHEGMETDHINGDGLDNRRSNLRNVSHRENMLNHKKRRDGTKKSKYIGAHYHAQNGKWQSEIAINGQRKYLGIFENEIDAHHAYVRELQKVA